MDSITDIKRKYLNLNLNTTLQKHHAFVPICTLFFLIVYQVDPKLFHLLVQTISDAYLAVSVFVALTLSLVYIAHRYLNSDLIGYLNNHQSMQVPIATFLGMLPGCGGAIIVVTQFVQGQVSFGALVAVLIATMGDASFLLLAREPVTAMLVLSISAFTAIIGGYLINKIHGHNFLKTPHKQTPIEDNRNQALLPPILLRCWLWLLLPGTILGIALAFQMETDAWFGPWSSHEPTIWLGFAGAIISIMIWLSQPLNSWSIHYVDASNSSDSSENSTPNSIWQSVAAETCFVSVWVIAGFLSFELLIYFTGWDLGSIFKTLGPLTPLFAILVGFIPGCGPQIIMTTLYLQGIVPLSAQLANAISNDGDALFPAIAMAPKAAIYATLYSAVPAFLLGYCMYFIEH